MKALHIVTWILIIVGALNWGIIGLGWLAGSTTDWNVVHMIFGGLGSSIEGIVYLLVGLSAVWEVVMHRKHCRMCGMGASMSSSSMSTSSM